MMLEAIATLRGAFIARLGLPVVLTRVEGDATPDLELTHGEGALPGIPMGLEAPATVRLTSGEESVLLRADVLPGALALLDPRDEAAGHADRRSAVVAGRVAVVTGGAQGFGEEIVRALHASGAWVFIADLNASGAQALAAELGERATPVEVNVADEASVEQMARTIVETTGGVDLVVSNAGIARAGSVLEQPLREFTMSTDVNYVAFFLVTQHLGRILRAQHRAAPDWLTDIVQINSKSGLAGSNRNGAYAGSKFGGIGLVQSFALELVDHGVKVNAICPGNFLDGPLWSDPVKGLFVQYWKSGKVPGAQSVEDVRRHYESKVPMRRGTYGADVMRALYYLVEQSYETGQALPVTGGQIMLN